MPINRDTTLDSQSWILHTQIAEEIIAASRHDLVICDRSVLDNYVYLLIAAGRQKPLEDLMRYWTATYDLLVHVPIVNDPRPYGLRATDPAFQTAVDERLLRELKQRELAFLDLCDIERVSWLDHVEERAWKDLEPRQLELL